MSEIIDEKEATKTVVSSGKAAENLPTRSISVELQRDVVDRVLIGLSTIASFATVCAVGIALLAYWSDQKADRVAETLATEQASRSASLSQIERFSTGDLLSARQVILKSIMVVGADQLQMIGSDEKSLADLKDAMASTSGDELTYDLALITLVDFFDGLEACISAMVCSLDVLEPQIGSYGARFYCFFQPFIEETKVELFLDGFGVGVKNWADRFGMCSTKA